MAIKRGAHTNDVVCDVLGGRSLVVSDDESPGVMSALWSKPYYRSCESTDILIADRFENNCQRRRRLFKVRCCRYSWKSYTGKRAICRECKAITCGAGDHCSEKILLPRAHHRRHVKVAT